MIFDISKYDTNYKKTHLHTDNVLSCLRFVSQAKLNRGIATTDFYFTRGLLLAVRARSVRFAIHGKSALETMHFSI